MYIVFPVLVIGNIQVCKALLTYFTKKLIFTVVGLGGGLEILFLTIILKNRETKNASTGF